MDSPKTSLFANRLLVAVILSLSVSIGCGDGKPPAFPTRGKVLFADGTPVKVGTIETKSILHDVQATAAIQLDGSFVFTTYKEGDGAVAGPHQCVVVQFVQSENIQNHKPSTLGVVNRKHASYATSNLKIDVVADKQNELIIQVEGVPKPLSGDSKGDHERGMGGHTNEKP